MGGEFAVPLVGNFDPPVLDAKGKLVSSTDLVTVSLVGTAQNDQFVVAPGSAADTWTITINGKSQTIQARKLNLSIAGAGGRDTVTLSGTAADDQIECWPNRATLVSANYTMSVWGMTSIIIDARAGNNSAKMHGAAGNDVLTSSSKTTLLSGAGFSDQVLGVPRMTIDGGTGGNDWATLTGTSNADAFFASSASASLCGTGYSINLTGFRTVRAQSGKSGSGSARLVGSKGNDTLTADATSSALSGAGFVFVATGFGVVSVDGGGGFDIASIGTGLLDGPVSASLIGTLPKSYRSAVWLSHFSQVRRSYKQPLAIAADKVFAAYWK
jgi:hypothetical protein